MISRQFAFIYFYYYIYHFYEVFLFIIYMVFICQLYFNNLYLLYNQFLTFNINIIYKIDNKDICDHIKRIYITKYHTKIVRKKLYKILDVNKLLYAINLYNNTFLQLYLNSLKLSGYIKSLNYMKIIINSKKYLKLCIKFNPIVKTIKINNYQHLIISSNKLKSILTDHLGLPMNYKLINASIKKILYWYKLQGFIWVQIELIQSQTLGNIKIIIIEGKLLSSKIICMNNNKINNYIFINNAIKSEIQLLHGYILNKQILDSKIHIIKQKYLLEEISYKILLNHKGVDIIVRYITKTNKSTNIYSYISFLNNIEQLLTNYSNKFIMSLYKIQQIFIYKYKIKYFFNFMINIDKYYLMNLKIYCINSYIYTFIQSFNFLIYYFHYLKYTWNLSLIERINSVIKQKLFIYYLINIEIKNEYFINEYLKCIQYMYYVKSKDSHYIINFNDIENNLNCLLKKYRQDTLSEISFYKIQIITDYSALIFSVINKIIIKINYYLFFYFNHKYDYTIQLNSQFFNLSIINKFILEHKNSSWNFKMTFNISKMFINKIKPLKMLIINSSNVKSYLYAPFINLYMNYSLYVNKYKKLYIFNDYSYNSKFDINSKMFFLGFGLQINIPFKKITYIRLEYIINMKKQIYLFIDKFSI